MLFANPRLLESPMLTAHGILGVWSATLPLLVFGLAANHQVPKRWPQSDSSIYAVEGEAELPPPS